MPKDILTSGFRHIEISDNGKLCRFVMEDMDKKPVAFQMPSSAIDTILPFFIKASTEAKVKAGESDVVTIYPIKTGEVSADDEGNVVFVFDLQEGANFAFRLDRSAADALASSLAEVLGWSVESGGPPDTRH